MRLVKQFCSAPLAMILFCCQNSAALAVPSAGTTSSVATVTETHGAVYKRDFIDWKKDAWGDPQPAKLGDGLEEGMQIGTGQKSWAQVSFPNVVTRAWENSVFAVAPNRKLVYLVGGEMLLRLDKHRKVKDDYYVWTKVLQARIHGTTVLVQATDNWSRITVLEGTIFVLNRIDHSVMRLNPGVVYEISTPTGTSSKESAGVKTSPAPTSASTPANKEAKSESNSQAKADGGDSTNCSGQTSKESSQQSADNARDHSAQNGGSETNSVSKDEGRKAEPIDVRSPNHAPIEVFQTSKDTTKVYAANAEVLPEHPLVTDFDTRLDSKPLIDAAMDALPLACHSSSLGPTEKTVSNVDVSNSLKNDADSSGREPLTGGVSQTAVAEPANNPLADITKGRVEVVNPPTLTSYKMGGDALSNIAIASGCLVNFPPAGIIGLVLDQRQSTMGSANGRTGYGNNEVAKNTEDGNNSDQQKGSDPRQTVISSAGNNAASSVTNNSQGLDTRSSDNGAQAVTISGSSGRLRTPGAGADLNGLPQLVDARVESAIDQAVSPSMMKLNTVDSALEAASANVQSQNQFSQSFLTKLNTLDAALEAANSTALVSQAQQTTSSILAQSQFNAQQVQNTVQGVNAVKNLQSAVQIQNVQSYLANLNTLDAALQSSNLNASVSQVQQATTSLLAQTQFNAQMLQTSRQGVQHGLESNLNLNLNLNQSLQGQLNQEIQDEIDAAGGD